MATTYGATFVSSAALGGDGAATTNQQAATSSNSTTEATKAMASALRFAASKSIRTSNMILASFNAMAAFATALGIIYGCYTYRRRVQGRSSNPPSGLFFIHIVEVFPLVLALGITIQSITFAAVQSIGLQALLSRGCATAAIFMFPALFIAPYIQLVFGVETAVRGARTQFSIRPKWTVTTCLGIVVTFLLLNLFVAVGNKAPDYCFASLFWIIEHYAGGCFALFLCIEIILIIVIVTIFVKLSRSYMVDPDERMAASRMIYYLSLGFISNAFIIPYFFSLTFLDQSKYIWETLNLSMVASVVSNVNGLMVAGLHLFLRSQNNSAIGHNFGGYEPRKSKYDPRDSSHEHRGSSHSMQPVTGANDDNRTSSGSFATLQHAVEAEEGEMGTAPTPSSPLRPITRPTITIPQSPRFPEPTRPPSAISPLQIRKQQSYSLFPSSPSAAAPTLPATAYSPVASKPTRSSFRPPPVVKPWLGRGHRRDSSIESSATVQIGIRLSNVDDFQNSKVSMDTIRPEAAVRPSPLAQVENRPASNYIASDVTPNVPRERPSIRDARNKTLPPVPTMCEDDDDTEAAGAGRNEGNDINGRMSDANQPITLGPSVYRPEDSSVTRSTSNRSVNRSARMPSLGRLRMSAALASRGTSDRGSVHAPPRPKGSAAKMVARMTKADWI